LLGSPAAASAQNLGRPTVGPTGVSDISDMTGMNCVIEKMKSISHWIGLRENLQETMVFTIKYRAFL
jgi:hypothetical protein